MVISHLEFKEPNRPFKGGRARCTDIQSLCNQMFRTVTIERHRQRRLASDDFTIKTLDRVPIIAETTITTTTT
ncbi:unnamed protein product, partial [Didymodactylos carnosus]